MWDWTSEPASPSWPPQDGEDSRTYNQLFSTHQAPGEIHLHLGLPEFRLSLLSWEGHWFWGWWGRWQGCFPGSSVVTNPPEPWVQSLVQEDPTCHRANGPVHHSYWGWALELTSCHYRVCMPQLLKPMSLEPALCYKRSHWNEKPAHCNSRKPEQQWRPSAAQNNLKKKGIGFLLCCHRECRL